VGLAVAALVLAAWLAGPVRAADDDAALRKRALALNEVTGDDPVRGEVLTLLDDKNKAVAKKLVAAAGKLLKEKKGAFNFNAAYVLANVAEGVKDNDNALAFYRVCVDEGTKLGSGIKMGQGYGGLIAVTYNSGNYKEAEKLCKEVLDLPEDDGGDPFDGVRRLKSVVLKQMVRVLAKQNKNDEANKLIDNLIKEQPENWLLLELRAWVQREAGQFDAAAKSYEEMLSRITKDKRLDKDQQTALANDVRYTLSGLYIDANQVDKAADQLKELLKGEPDNPSYNNDLGYIWADHDMNLPEAEKLIRKAIDDDKKQRQKDNPDLKPEEVKANPAYLDSLGWVLFKQKKYKEALPPLEEAVKEEEGQHIEIFDHLAEVHLALGSKAAAVAAWKKGVEHVGTSKREQQKKADVEKKLKANQ
jgi:tetratricopeptide (TPR) repeat protein